MGALEQRRDDRKRGRVPERKERAVGRKPERRLRRAAVLPPDDVAGRRAGDPERRRSGAAVKREIDVEAAVRVPAPVGEDTRPEARGGRGIGEEKPAVPGMSTDLVRHVALDHGEGDARHRRVERDDPLDPCRADGITRPHRSARCLQA